MTFFDDQIRTANNFLDLLDRPRQFRQQLRNDFFTNMDQSRETFVQNQRVPERLSETALNTRQNEFDLQDLNNNFGIRLETSGIQSQNDLTDAQFIRDNGDVFREGQLSDAEVGIARNRTEIEEFAALEEFRRLTRENPFVAGSSGPQYYRDLISASSSHPTSDIVRELVVEDFQTRMLNPQLETIRSVRSNLRDLQLAAEGARAQGLRQIIRSDLERLDSDTIYFAAELGLIPPEVLATLENLTGSLNIEFTRGTGGGTVGLPEETPVVPTTETPSVETTTPIQPTQPTPSSDIVQTPVPQTTEPVQPSELDNLRIGSPQIYEVINRPVTKDNLESFLQLREIIETNPSIFNDPEIRTIVQQREIEFQRVNAQIDIDEELRFQRYAENPNGMINDILSDSKYLDFNIALSSILIDGRIEALERIPDEIFNEAYFTLVSAFRDPEISENVLEYPELQQHLSRLGTALLRERRRRQDG